MSASRGWRGGHSLASNPAPYTTSLDTNRRLDGHCLTTLPHYQDSTPRIKIADRAALGLRKPGYLWGWPTDVSILDIHDPIGRIDKDTAQQIIAMPGLHATLATLLGENETLVSRSSPDLNGSGELHDK